MNRTRAIQLFIAIVIIGVGVILGTFIDKQMRDKQLSQKYSEGVNTPQYPTETEPSPTPTIIPARLQFEKTTVINTIMNESSIAITLDAHGMQISNSDLYLLFDPKAIKILSFDPGELFPNPLIFNQTIDKEPGKASLALGSIEPASESGIIATVRFQPLSLGNTNLTIATQSMVIAKGPVTVPVIIGKPVKITVQE
jgi:hypothetical protein